MALADELAGMGIERVVIESTSDYWRPFFYLLEARGLCVWLVCQRSAKFAIDGQRNSRLI